MANDDIIEVWCFGEEIGRLGWDEDLAISTFQFNPHFLESNRWQNLFPPTRVISRVPTVQIFRKYNSETFRGIPPIFADSLPDLFGNIIFKTWLENKKKDFSKISVVEQLAYVAERGMGALEYKPSKKLPDSVAFDINEIVAVLQEVMNLKKTTVGNKLDSAALLTIFKIGSSAGGARPKILISRHKKSGKIVPGDLHTSEEYDHFLVKLNLNDQHGYNEELIEYSYYAAARACGIDMMDSEVIEGKHFATKRFDRTRGEKNHVLTASGMTGWDFKDPEKSSYENLFDLALFLKLPHAQIEQLFRRMVFNIVFCNIDDHLKNHSFIYDREADRWHLAPAYDLTYSLNPLMNYKKVSRALSVNGKRADISMDDVTAIAKKYTVKKHTAIIEDVLKAITVWKRQVKKLAIPEKVITSITKDFNRLS